MRLLAGLFLASLLLTAVTLAYVAYLFLPIS